MTSSLSLLYFPTAIALGALHALEPGHAKTLTAAYLIGIKGTKRDAILLGLSVAATHSVVVVAIALLGLWFGREAFADEAGRWLQLGSGMVVILLGTWMVWRRWPRKITHTHTHAPDPVAFEGNFAKGTLRIIDTPSGERLECQLDQAVPGLELAVEIDRPGGPERLPLTPANEILGTFLSDVAPAEPHEFTAKLHLRFDGRAQALSFAMLEPEHHHGHADLSEIEHARAHAASLPQYVQAGERPTMAQVLAFGAAGGMIPCPASITVMLLAVSIGQAALGILMVIGFSLGLALALVGIGLVVVLGLSRMSKSGRFDKISRYTGLISASVVILSGMAALLVALMAGHH